MQRHHKAPASKAVRTDTEPSSAADRWARASGDALAALEQARARMDELLGIVGHELRTPLTSAKVNVQMAARYLRKLLDASEPESELAADLARLDDLLHRIERQLDRQNRLVRDLLDVSHIQTGQLELHEELCDLATIVCDVVAEHRLAHPRRDISLDLPTKQTENAPNGTRAASLLSVLADPDRIGQVIGNYLSNALKYSPENAPVAVWVRRVGRHARVSVHDSGPGLPPEEHAHIWERFYRAPAIEHQTGSSVGLGLGLHISKTIVERFGGTVGVTSAPREGCTFWFTLPLA